MSEQWVFTYNYGIPNDEPEEEGFWKINIDKETFFKLLNKFLDDIDPQNVN